MAGRSGIGGRSRRRSGLAESLIDAGIMPAPPPPRTWQVLLGALVVCDEVTPTFAEPVTLDWLCDLDEPPEAST